MGQILLVRHGQASFGTDDYDRLSEIGHEQARLLGNWLSGCGKRIDLAVTGSLLRHKQTAESCLEGIAASLRPSRNVADADFDEYNYEEIMAHYRPDLADPRAMQRHVAESENPRRTFQAIFAESMQRWIEGKHDNQYRMSWNAFRERCVAALKRTVDSAERSQNIVVFTSGGPIAAICQHLLDLPGNRTYEVNFSLVNGAVTGLLYQPGRVSLHYLNSYAHLESTGNARVITYR
jgi:broad specificity phosphatase PhoE